MPAHSMTARTEPPAITPVPGGRTQDGASSVVTLNRVGDGAADARHREHSAFGVQLALGDGGGTSRDFAVADTHGAVAVADHNQCGEAEGTGHPCGSWTHG